MEYFTVLEIGSGSFKLHKENNFSLRFESSLGKGLVKGSLNSESILISKNSIENKILPFLKEHLIDTSEVLVFATSAIRQAMNDPNGSGRYFIDMVKSYGFKDVNIFSEAQECEYAAWAVLQEIGDLHDQFQMLDTGGASHQLVEFKDQKIIKKQSFPIGSHSNLNELSMPDFSELGFSKSLPIAIIGTTGFILNHVFNCNRNTIKEMIKTMENQSIEERRNFLKLMISEDSVYELFVDFRLAVMPNALKIIYNCVDSLNSNKFLLSTSQAMNYISRYGFTPFEASK
jgi:hypothetical protein